MPRRRTLLIIAAALIAVLLWIDYQRSSPEPDAQLSTSGDSPQAASRSAGPPGRRDKGRDADLTYRAQFKRVLSSDGRVRIHGTVRGPEGEALASVPILLIPVGSKFEYQVSRAFDLVEQGREDELPEELRQGLEQPSTLTAGADGSFEFHLEASAPLGVLMARRPGYAPDWGSLDRRLGEWRREMGFDAQSWPRELRFDLQLQSEGRISGRVLEAESGAPAVGAAVEIFEAASSRRVNAGNQWVVSGEPLAVASVDGQGRYQFFQLGPAVYALMAGSGRQAYALGSGDSRRVRLEAGQYLSEVNFTLQPGGVLAARVVDSRGSPLRDAVCAVLPHVSRLSPRNIETQALGMARYGQDRSDAAGRCFIKGLWLDKPYVLTVYHPDLISQNKAEFTVTPPEGRKEVEVRLWRHSQIAGWSVVGEGERVAYVMVSLNSLDLPQDQQVDLSERSDREGRFVFQGLAPGRYRLGGGDSGQSSGNHQEIHLRPGEVKADLQVKIADAWTSLAGRVVDEAGAGIEGAQVEVMGASNSGGDFNGLKTDSQGYFSTDRLLGDTFYLTVNHFDYQSERLNKVAAGQRDVRFVLRRKVVLSGRLVDSSGRPILEEDVTVVIRRMGGPLQGGRIISDSHGSTDSEGRFTLRCSAGAIRLEAQAKGFAKGATEVFKTSPGDTIESIRLELSSEVLASGRVIDHQGQSVQGAEVSVHEVPEDGGRSRIYSSDSYSDSADRLVTSDVEGLFQATGLGAGRYSFRAEHPDWAPSEPLEIKIPQGAREVELTDLRLRSPVSIQGKVTKDGQARPSEVVYLYSQSAYGIQASTGADGSFWFRGVTPGICVLKTGDADSAALQRIDLKEGGTHNVTLELVPKAEVSLKVVNGLPNRRYRIWLRVVQQAGDPRFATGRRINFGLSGPDGKLGLLIRADAPGQYLLEVFNPLDHTSSAAPRFFEPPLFRKELSLRSGLQTISVELPQH